MCGCSIKVQLYSKWKFVRKSHYYCIYKSFIVWHFSLYTRLVIKYSLVKDTIIYPFHVYEEKHYQAGRNFFAFYCGSAKFFLHFLRATFKSLSYSKRRTSRCAFGRVLRILFDWILTSHYDIKVKPSFLATLLLVELYFSELTKVSVHRPYTTRIIFFNLVAIQSRVV